MGVVGEETESSSGAEGEKEKELFKEVTVSPGEFQRVQEVCLRSFGAWSEAEKQCKESFGAPELLESLPGEAGESVAGNL